MKRIYKIGRRKAELLPDKVKCYPEGVWLGQLPFRGHALQERRKMAIGDSHFLGICHLL